MPTEIDIQETLIEAIKQAPKESGAKNALEGLLSSAGGAGIPVVGALPPAIEAISRQRDINYFNTIKSFVENLEHCSDEERREFTEKLERDRETERFGRNILLLLEKVDDTLKPQIMGKILAAAISKKIDLNDAMRTIAMVNRCYVQDLNILANYPGSGDTLTEAEESLAASGFLTSPNNRATMDMTILRNLKANKYAEIVVKYGLAVQPKHCD